MPPLILILAGLVGGAALVRAVGGGGVFPAAGGDRREGAYRCDGGCKARDRRKSFHSRHAPRQVFNPQTQREAEV